MKLSVKGQVENGLTFVGDLVCGIYSCCLCDIKQLYAMYKIIKCFNKTLYKQALDQCDQSNFSLQNHAILP